MPVAMFRNPTEALAAIKKHQSGPVAICMSEDIGHMLPDQTWPELSRDLMKNAQKALAEGKRPVQIELTDKDYPPSLGKNPKEVYFIIKMRALFTAEERRVDSLLRGYQIPLFYIHLESRPNHYTGEIEKIAWLVDGQQRIRACMEFAEGQFEL